MNNKYLISNKIDGTYSYVYSKQMITQAKFENFIRVINGHVTLKNVCFIDCDLTNVDFSIITHLEDVVISNCKINDTTDKWFNVKFPIN